MKRAKQLKKHEPKAKSNFELTSRHARKGHRHDSPQVRVRWVARVLRTLLEGMREAEGHPWPCPGPSRPSRLRVQPLRCYAVLLSGEGGSKVPPPAPLWETAVPPCRTSA